MGAKYHATLRGFAPMIEPPMSWAPEVEAAARRIVAVKKSAHALDAIPKAPQRPTAGPGLAATARILRYEIDLEEHVKELDAWRLEAMYRIAERTFGERARGLREPQLERILRARNIVVPPRESSTPQNYRDSLVRWAADVASCN